MKNRLLNSRRTGMLAALVLLFHVSLCYSQADEKHTIAKSQSLSWKQLATRMPDVWYTTAEARSIADSVMKYQTKEGGWIKNTDFQKGVAPSVWKQIGLSGLGATFDNGATIMELNFLTKMYLANKEERYQQAFLKGLQYILKAQYANGGWPQFFPTRPGNVSYSAHITYNDNAMINVMQFLKKVLAGGTPFTLSPDLRESLDKAFKKGVDCVLKTQIQIAGKLTVWCAQHDEVTLLPAKARAYELASFSGAESVGITLFLMDLPKPSPAVKTAVDAAVSWFEKAKIQGVKMQTIVNAEGQEDRVVVTDNAAPPVWARFYDLETGEPFFCDRDGIKRKTFAELGYNRRNGYSWYTDSPAKVLSRYTEWKQQFDAH